MIKTAARATGPTGPPASRCHIAMLLSAIIAIQAKIFFVSGGIGSDGCMYWVLKLTPCRDFQRERRSRLAACLTIEFDAEDHPRKLRDCCFTGDTPAHRHDPLSDRETGHVTHVRDIF